MGNWADRIDELESENFDLLEENRRLDDEVTDLLYEVDLLKDKLASVQEERDNLEKQLDQVAHEHYLDWARAEAAERRVKELESLLAKAVGRAETAEVLAEDYRASNDSWRESFEITIEAYDEVQSRANIWFEVAKDLVRTRDFWVEIAQEHYDKAAEADENVQYWEESSWEDSEDFYTLMGDLDAVQERANSWFEVAKDLVRARDFWVEIAQEQFDKAAEAERAVQELKSALRVLGS